LDTGRGRATRPLNIPIPIKVSLIVMNNFDKTHISIELSRLIERQTKFFEKSDPTLSETSRI
jgi:hypothetical protein